MAVEMFLQFVGASTTGITVVGESVDKAHPQTIVVNAVDFSVENPTTIGSMSAGAGAGKAKLNPVKVSKHVDSASPTLFQALATGAHFPVMKLFVRRAGATAPADYAIYQFNLVFISNIDISVDGGGETLQETVEMVYGALQVSYTPMTTTGTLGKQQIATWNQVTSTDKLDMPVV